MHPARPQNIPTWSGIVFDASQIRPLWPKPRPDVDEWMRKDFQDHPEKKRDDRIKDCRKENDGCTTIDAREAIKRIPDRRGRGQKTGIVK